MRSKVWLWISECAWVCAVVPQDSSTALVIFDLDLFSLHLKVQVLHFQPLNIPTYRLTQAEVYFPLASFPLEAALTSNNLTCQENTISSFCCGLGRFEGYLIYFGTPKAEMFLAQLLIPDRQLGVGDNLCVTKLGDRALNQEASDVLFHTFETSSLRNPPKF